MFLLFKAFYSIAFPCIRPYIAYNNTMMFEVKEIWCREGFSVNRDEKRWIQIQTLMDQPFVEGAKVRIMPDYHCGRGCTIGFTANLGRLRGSQSWLEWISAAACMWRALVQRILTLRT